MEQARRLFVPSLGSKWFRGGSPFTLVNEGVQSDDQTHLHRDRGGRLRGRQPRLGRDQLGPVRVDHQVGRGEAAPRRGPGPDRELPVRHGDGRPGAEAGGRRSRVRDGRLLSLRGHPAPREPEAPRPGGGAFEEGLGGRAPVHRGHGDRAREPGGQRPGRDRPPREAGRRLSERAAGPGDPRPGLPGLERGGEGARRPREGEPHRAAALDSLKTYLAEYKDSGAAQGFPEVFIWNSIARINLENGRLDEAMKAYESGYLSVPGSGLPEDQKQIWLGRLRHGRCRVLAKMGKHEEAWGEAEKVKKMIEDGGEPGKQFLPAYHYLAGYLKLEAGDAKAAIEELKQANPQDAFHVLLLGRAYENAGDKVSARKAANGALDSGQTAP